MDFDFHTQFRNYSIAQLLEILREPHAYQDAAVQAAQAILAERDPQDVESERARMYAIPERLPEAEAASIFDESEPGYDPRHILIMRILVIAVCAYYTITQIIGAVGIIYLIDQFEGPEILIALISPFISVAFYVSIAVLLMKALRLGWYLGMGLSLFTLVSRISAMVYQQTLRDEFSGAGIGSAQLVHVLLSALVIFVLWTPAMRDAYRISPRGFSRTCLIGIGLGLLPVLYVLMLV